MIYKEKNKVYYELNKDTINGMRKLGYSRHSTEPRNICRAPQYELAAKAGFTDIGGLCYGAVAVWGQCLRNALNSNTQLMLAFNAVVSDGATFTESCGYYQYVQSYTNTNYIRDLGEEPERITTNGRFEPITSGNVLDRFASRDTFTLTKTSRYDVKRDEQDIQDHQYYEPMMQLAKNDSSTFRQQYSSNDVSEAFGKRMHNNMRNRTSVFGKLINEEKFVEISEHDYGNDWVYKDFVEYLHTPSVSRYEPKLQKCFDQLTRAAIANSEEHPTLIYLTTVTHAMGIYVPRKSGTFNKTNPEFFDPNIGIYQRPIHALGNTKRADRIKKLMEFVHYYIRYQYLDEKQQDIESSSTASVVVHAAIYVLDSGKTAIPKTLGKKYKTRFRPLTPNQGRHAGKYDSESSWGENEERKEPSKPGQRGRRF